MGRKESNKTKTCTSLFTWINIVEPKTKNIVSDVDWWELRPIENNLLKRTSPKVIKVFYVLNWTEHKISTARYHLKIDK